MRGEVWATRDVQAWYSDRKQNCLLMDSCWLYMRWLISLFGVGQWLKHATKVCQAGWVAFNAHFGWNIENFCTNNQTTWFEMIVEIKDVMCRNRGLQHVLQWQCSAKQSSFRSSQKTEQCGAGCYSFLEPLMVGCHTIQAKCTNGTVGQVQIEPTGNFLRGLVIWFTGFM